jgi:ATP synthase protein I
MDGGRRDPDTGRRGGEQDPKIRAGSAGETAKPHKAGTASSAATGGELAGIGIQFAAVILVFTAFGVWLDRKLGSSPWFTIVFVFVGAAGGFFSMYRKVMAAQRRDTERRDAERNAAKRGQP